VRQNTKTVGEIAELTKELPERLQEEVRDFARFLVEKRARPIRKKLRLDWAGGLKGLREKYTSVELQHKILDYWVEAALDGCPSAEAIRRELRAVGSADRNRSRDSNRDTASTTSTPGHQQRNGHDFDRTERGRRTPADILGEPPIARNKPPTKPSRPRSRKR
jgi:hypothetical protein